MSPKRLVLFIDDQNVRKSARSAFFLPTYHHVYGQVDPVKLGNLICSKTKPEYVRTLHQVRVYTGRPDSRKEPTSYAAHMKQCDYWEKCGVKVIHRKLRYPQEWPNEKPIQKGVDVALALDFVIMACDDDYDIGVIASTDRDLIPAMEFVYSRFKGSPSFEVMAWAGTNWLSIPKHKIWCHHLDINDYNNCADLTDYTK